MSCDLCTYAQLILNKSVAFPHRGCKSRAERTTPIVGTKHYCSVGTTHGCRWARQCYDHCRLRKGSGGAVPSIKEAKPSLLPHARWGARRIAPSRAHLL